MLLQDTIQSCRVIYCWLPQQYSELHLVMWRQLVKHCRLTWPSIWQCKSISREYSSCRHLLKC
ncbi:hypothetical protein KC19_11G076000 [Ceratodon purpureus]|uniref:Uncharacterized protein n=1 Tax=Ceratodon purpureus TaxID=3225 RepID=A0A8T0GBI9_CERPU|nr:hypothetical protein KC19_11G076000 [Ceratodon purpureus]